MADTKGFRLHHTMVRAKDPVKTIHFYQDLLGMTLLMKKGEDELLTLLVNRLSLMTMMTMKMMMTRIDMNTLLTHFFVDVEWGKFTLYFFTYMPEGEAVPELKTEVRRSLASTSCEAFFVLLLTVWLVAFIGR